MNKCLEGYCCMERHDRLLENGISEYDVYDRLQNAIPLFGAKLWGKDDKTLSQENNLRVTLGDASGTNFGYETIKMKTLLLIMI